MSDSIRAVMLVVGILGMSFAQACVEPGSGDEASTSTAEQAVTTGPPGTWQETLIPSRSYWSYFDRGALAGSAWRNSSSCGMGECFLTAQAPMGYGESYLATTIDYGPSASNKYRTTYFRTSFYPQRPVRALFLRVMYDDGFVFYLNGHEGGRASMPSGTITSSTLATGHEAENMYVTFDISAQIPRLVQNGSNWLAFEVHQQSASSSDLVFDAELIAWEDGPLDVTSHEGIPRGDYWHLWDRAGVPATWKSPALDDSGWSAGPGGLGFGETYLKTTVASGPISTYFRKQFTIAGSVHGLSADVMYDDGFVAYLNGTEIGRASMPAGAVTGSTLALGHEAGNTYQTFDWDAAVPLLVDGENLLAVEVHQNSAGSSDLVFDLGLRVEGAWTPQPSGTTQWFNDVHFTDATHGWVVGWNGTLRRTTDGGATWTTQPTGTAEALNAISFADASNGWIVGYAGVILHTTDGGATWTAQSAGTATSFYDVSFVSPTTGWIAGDEVYKTTDGGATWTAQPIESDNAVAYVDFADASNGWAAFDNTDSGTAIYRTTDGGATWTGQGPFTSVYVSITDLEVVDANTAWITRRGYHDDANEVKIVTRDGGLTWTLLPATANDVELESITFFDALHGWAVGAGGSLIATTDGGYTWEIQQVPALDPDSDRVAGLPPWYSAIAFGSLDAGWVVGSNGALLHTSTGGW